MKLQDKKHTEINYYIYKNIYTLHFWIQRLQPHPETKIILKKKKEKKKNPDINQLFYFLRSDFVFTLLHYCWHYTLLYIYEELKLITNTDY